MKALFYIVLVSSLHISLSAFDQSPERFEGECNLGMKVRCMLAAEGYIRRYENSHIDAEKVQSKQLAKEMYQKACTLGVEKACAKLKTIESL